VDSIGLPRRQFLGQRGSMVASAAVLNSPLVMQAFAAQPGEEIILWSDQPSADPGVVRGAIQNLQHWEDLDWLTPNSRFFNIAHYNRSHIDEQDWSLEITGLVRKPGRFRLSDIRARPRREPTFTFECSGNNGRPSFMTASAPPAGPGPHWRRCYVRRSCWTAASRWSLSAQTPARSKCATSRCRQASHAAWRSPMPSAPTICCATR
jgi:DMSO/TMAO reductase YedYZ molybdopterin-dependent catalytic subunit